MRIRSYLLFLIPLFLLLAFTLLNLVISSGEEIKILEAIPQLDTESGSANVPVTEINLGIDNSFNINPGRLKFEFNSKWYGVQLREVGSGYSIFLIMNLDDGLTDYVSDEKIASSFTLNKDEIKEIDLDKDGKLDLTIELKDTFKDAGSIGFAHFFIKEYNIDKEERAIESIDLVESNNSTESTNSLTTE